MKFITKSAFFPRAIVFAAIFAVANFVSFAKDAELNFLKPGKPDASEILAPPPLIGSPEQAGDMAEVKTVYHAVGSNDIAAAYSEKKFSVFNFTIVGEFFIETNLPITAKFFNKVQADAEIVTDTGKDFFKRPRPYTTDPTLINGKLESSFSYPSGHSTESMTLALVLADLIPAQRDAILAHARTMGWHRVQIARHYPTDIFAGRVLAQAIVKQFKKSDTYQEQFEAAKKEIEAARKAVLN